ncbi:hypothetical protein P280DRAFT_390365 [Massarina eburnea CBS 473.64]|uniref:Brl1/Brr6 domain-containing protein n=1 Tax=Massarina eburnea CBS 473.64 TaxID=1395130 RepID=A0A6A6SD49_9PLEO|nr:hypothetical protein P280DRAFT_390365 [Massarina eburnea CBS 473.64]
MSRHRQSTTPMDFEWQNQTGRVDTSSPFITSQSAAKKRKLSPSAPGLPLPEQELNTSHPFGVPGTHSTFDSPSKNPTSFATPNRPQLREANNQHFLFSGQRPLPSIPSHVQSSSAWEPRTPQSVVDFSSGGETPNTPAQDSDIATPDTQLASRMGGLSHGAEKGSRKSKRDSIMGFFGRTSPSPSSPSSPSKDPKDTRDRPYSKKAEHRVMKRRSRKGKHAMARDYDSDDEDTGHDMAVARPPAAGILANIPGALSWVEAHPTLPMVLSYYMQFIINATLGFTFLYIIYSALMAIFNDVNIEASHKAQEIMHEIAVCANHYRQNMCDGRRMPALEDACRSWEACMKQDVRKIAKASVGAKAGAKILNSFAEEFSYKSMLFTAILLFGGFNLSNWAFNRIRKDPPPSYPQQNHQHMYDYPPATPQRQLSGGYGGMAEQNGWQTPYGTPYGNMQRPMLQHASQSLPALPSNVGGGAEQLGDGDESVRGSPMKKGWTPRR